jgi:signal transduction histidine kinase
MDLAGMYINFVDKKNESLITSPNMDSEVLEAFKKNIAFPEGQEEYFRNIDIRDRHLRLINYPYHYKGQTDYLIQIAASPQPIALMLRDWLNAMILSIPVILVLTSFVGRLFAERILRPVDEITALAHQITLEDLTTRMTTKNYPIEMASLINSFNEMIDRMQTSFTHIEEFSSLAAHELKTPLTIIRGESELALMGQRSVEDYRRALKVNLEESEQMLRTIDDLLFLTKLDYQPEIFQFSNVNLTEFLGEVYDQAKILAEKYKVDIRFVPAKKPAMVRADKVHLRRLFFNLIDNASKFTPADGGIVTIRMDLSPKKVFVHIIDNGCGIAPENLPKIFNRFYREQHKRVGNGLGLNIALSIAKIHQGEIKVVSEQGKGSTFTVMLPMIT